MRASRGDGRPATWPNRLADSGIAGFLHRVLLFTLFISLPWELFQQTPWRELTLSKLAGAMAIVLAFLQVAATRSWKAQRTGLEGPMLAFLLAGCVSIFYSENRGLSIQTLGMYATYVALFYGMVVLVRDQTHARALLLAFLVSCGVLGAVSIACSAGLLTPAVVRQLAFQEFRLTPDLNNGITFRMAAAGEDLNRAVLPLLVALCTGLYLFDGRTGSLSRRFSIFTLLALSLAGVIVAMSRSSLLAIGIVTLFWVFGSVRRKKAPWKLWAGTLLLLVILASAGHEYTADFVGRLLQGFGTRDASYEGRLSVFEATWALLPDYWLLGSGLGASGSAFDHSPYAALTAGRMIHSVPIMVLFEIGIFGLAAYLWLWFAIFRQIAQYRRKANSTAAREHAAALVAGAFACCIVTSVQPFFNVALFPAMLGMAFGPLVYRSKEKPDLSPASTSPASSTAVAVAALISVVVVASVVLPNMICYQTTSRWVARFADRLENGAQAESAARWIMAQEEFAAALANATDAGGPDTAPQKLGERQYFPIAAKVHDLRFVLDEMGIGFIDPDPVSICAYGLGRTAIALGEAAEAERHLNAAIDAEPEFSEASYTLAELRWTTGRFPEALQAYRQAVESETRKRNAVYRQRTVVTDARIASLLDNEEVHTPALLEAGRLLRRRGRWQEAVTIYRRIAEKNPGVADAQFHLGAAEEIRHETSAARRRYELALEALPNHFDALQRYSALADGP